MQTIERSLQRPLHPLGREMTHELSSGQEQGLGLAGAYSQWGTQARVYSTGGYKEGRLQLGFKREIMMT